MSPDRWVRLTTAGVALLCAGELHGARPLLLWNTTASAPVGVYIVAPWIEPRRGQYVVARPDTHLAAWLSVRGYLPPHVPLVKRLAAAPGQEVCRYGARILVDGSEAARARYADRWGRPLPEWAGCRRVAVGQMFLLNAAPDSLDGRYFGLTDARAMVGTALPLLVRDGR